MPYAGAFQSTILGRVIRLTSRNRLLKYPDEVDFPEDYTREAIARKVERQQREKPQRDRDSGAERTDNDSSTTKNNKDNGRLEKEVDDKADNKNRRREKDVEKPLVHSQGTQTNDIPERTLSSSRLNHYLLGPPIDDLHPFQSAATLTNPTVPDGSGDYLAEGDESRSEDGNGTSPDAGRGRDATEFWAPETAEEKRREPQSGAETKKKSPVSGDEAEKGEDPNLVTWYGEADAENPYNWSSVYKSFVAFQMGALTFSVYIGSSIYSAGITGPNPDSVTKHFNVSDTTALVGLTVFIAGYGIGPMLWAPLTEFPQIGRLPVYVITQIAFVALQFPTIYANNIHTLLAMRFLAGFVGSPALAVGGATMADMFPPKYLAYAIGVWGCGAICGPVLGPLLGGFTYAANGWRWPLWVLTWLSAGALVFIVFFFPETSGKTILHRRMVRLRASTKNPHLKTQAEIEAADMTGAKIASIILWRPVVLFWEPTLLVYNTYLALIYGLLYVWFESFPLVFEGVHGFNPGESGLAFMGIFIGAVGACLVFCYYIRQRLEPIFDANGGVIPLPEIRLYPAPIAAFCIPIAMFGFGWSGQYESVHWIVPIIFTGFFGIGAFILFQTIFAYFGDVYFTELGSVLTLNDLFRASFGAAFPLFSNGMFSRLGIGGGNSLLGALACLFIPAPFLFIKYGTRIRLASKYAKHDSD